MISFFSDWDGHAAEQEFQRAIALEPNYATAHHWYGLDLAAMGRLPESLSEVRRARQLDPLSLIINTNVGWVLYLSRHYDEAITEFRKALELDPDFPRARTRLGITYMQKGDFAAATRELGESLRLSGQDPYIAGVLGEARALAGDNAGARRILDELKKRSKQHYVPPFSLALICIGLGAHDEALQWLVQAYDDHSTSMVYAKIDPSLDPMRSDPRFRELLRRMKF
jgi:Flp pilus assembly protein TadD